MRTFKKHSVSIADVSVEDCSEKQYHPSANIVIRDICLKAGII